MLREDVEDEHCAVEDLELGEVTDRARLAGRQVLIEDHRVGAELHGAHQDLLQLAAPDQEARIRLRPALDDDVERVHAGGAAELAQLGDARVRVAAAPDRHVNEERARRARPAGHRPGAPRELRLQRGHELGDVQLQVVGRLRLQLEPQLALRVVRQRMADEHAPRLSARVHGDGGDQVEPQEGEVGEVVLGQRLAAQVGVNQAQAAKPAGPAAQTADVRQHQL
jgi:hypothetical protein